MNEQYEGKVLDKEDYLVADIFIITVCFNNILNKDFHHNFVITC